MVSSVYQSTNAFEIRTRHLNLIGVYIINIVKIFIAVVFLNIFMLGSAWADKPVIFESSTTFLDINPCTGLEHEITINLVAKNHSHTNNILQTVSSEFESTDGFYGRGIEMSKDQFGTVNFNFVLNLNVKNPDTGQAFRVMGRTLITGDGVVLESFQKICYKY